MSLGPWSVPRQRAASDLSSPAANEPLCQSSACELVLECSCSISLGAPAMQVLLYREYHCYVEYEILVAIEGHLGRHPFTASAQCRSGWPPHVIRIKTRILRNADSNGSLRPCLSHQRVKETVTTSRFEALLITAYLDFIAAMFIRWLCRSIYLEP